MVSALGRGLRIGYDCLSSPPIRQYGLFLAQSILNQCVVEEPRLRYFRVLDVYSFISGGKGLVCHALKLRKESLKTDRILSILLNIHLFAKGSGNLLKTLDAINFSAILVQNGWTRADTVFRIVRVTAHPLWVVGTCLSVMYLIIHFHEYARIYECLEKCKANQEGETTVNLQGLSPAELEMYFHFPAKKMSEQPYPLKVIIDRLHSVLFMKEGLVWADTFYTAASFSQLLEGKNPSRFTFILKKVSLTLLQLNCIYQFFSAHRFEKILDENRSNV